NLENCKAKNYSLIPQRTNLSNKLLWRIDFKSLEENINENTKAIVIVEPHNPIGSRLNPEDAANLVLIAKTNNLILIVDEVFSDYLEGYYNVNPYEGANCIYLNGLSKTLALPQMKLSWIYLTGSSIFVEQMKEALEIISDTYLSVNIPVQIGLETLLETANKIQSQIQNRAKSNSIRIADLLKEEKGIESFLPDGGWNMILKLKEPWEDEEFAFRLLEEQGVYVYPGYMFDMPGSSYIVISLILSTEMIEEGMRRICSLLSLD
ncbi:MAG: pyridoxal phosphate-dependent aminotransferase, partial [Leptospiraceae bacterium]|nr:pyridoxal phosphate-dependent aminotransferase [Leptospiraceae bacterium]